VTDIARGLEDLGWRPEHAEVLDVLRSGNPGLLPCRISEEHRGLYKALTPEGEFTAEVTGAFRHEHVRPEEFPSVGDWCAGVPVTGEAKLRIQHVLPRRTAFRRTAAGETSDVQVVAANVDTVCLVSGLDGDFNPRRIERYLTLAYDSGARPVVVLNKADMAEDLIAALQAVEQVALGVPAHPVSALTGEGLPPLNAYLMPGETIALLGSSGAGKSTLVNALAGAERMATGAVREDDSRGRHTTTHRQLIALPGGAMLIDTPGMREIQLTGDESGLAETFGDIEAMADECRYNDCAHEGEPGCAVAAALETGSLSPARLEAWRKLQKELDYAERRQRESFKHDERQRNKDLSKMYRRVQNEARRNKGT